MPYLKFQTNKQLENEEDIITKVSKLVARELEKSEEYVMVAVEPNVKMSFGGSFEPTVFIQLKSIGLPESKTKQISAALSNLMEEELGIPNDHVYIEFTDVKRTFWGYNGSTF